MWYKEIDTIVLNNNKYYKPASFIMISYCPECGEKSWNHFDLRNVVSLCDIAFEEHEEAFNAIKNELKRRQKKMESDWAESLCKSCSRFEKKSSNYLYYRVECCEGGFSGHCRSECDKYKMKE
jgi:hypothetical protein